MRAAHAALIGLMFAAAWPLSGQHAAPQLSIGAITSLLQGDVRPLVVTGTGDAAKLTATVFDRTVHLSTIGGGKWDGLIGVDLAQKAGSYPLVVTAILPDGLSATAHTTITVNARSFSTRKLSVNPRFVEPSDADAARIAAEAKQLAAIWEAASERRWQGPFHPPVAGPATSNFGSRSIFNRQPRAPHAGIDYRGAVGTPIVAPNAGRVVLAGDLFFTGNTVVVDHGLGLYSLFAHLSRMSVKAGDDVARLAPVGLVGATGRVTGPHLHWSVRLGGARVDPASLLLAVP